MRKVFIVAPAGAATGGPELSHQLCDYLNREVRRAWIIYYPFGSGLEAPLQYHRYNTESAMLSDVDSDSIVVLPEVYSALLRNFNTSHIYFWWQSVDNFFKIAGRTRTGRILGERIVAHRQLQNLDVRVELHLYQSEYARIFLESKNISNVAPLSDFLADEFVQAVLNPPQVPKENLIVYNPAKGQVQADKILGAYRQYRNLSPEIVPIKGHTRDEVVNLLSRAKVYFDFGNHPGKDRIPREAVAMGACLIVNRRGSAKNSVDIPIADRFKIDDRSPGFETEVAALVHYLLEHYELERREFDEYRNVIAEERKHFINDAASLFERSE